MSLGSHEIEKSAKEPQCLWVVMKYTKSAKEPQCLQVVMKQTKSAQEPQCLWVVMQYRNLQRNHPVCVFSCNTEICKVTLSLSSPFTPFFISYLNLKPCYPQAIQKHKKAKSSVTKWKENTHTQTHTHTLYTHTKTKKKKNNKNKEAKVTLVKQLAKEYQSLVWT